MLELPSSSLLFILRAYSTRKIITGGWPIDGKIFLRKISDLLNVASENAINEKSTNERTSLEKISKWDE